MNLSETHDLLCIEITDSGPGIPDDIKDKVFDPFFTTKAEKGGTGLGLSIIKNIIDVHEGQILLSNRAEGGVRTLILFQTEIKKDLDNLT